MSSIYKQMDKIDDNKSLNEKWNVKNQRELKKLKEDVQKLDETSPLVKEIQEYIHDNIFEWDTIGFENDHIYVVFNEDTEEYTIDSCEEEIEDEFGHACELEFELENENTLLIYVSISDEIDDDNYEWFVEHQVDYSLRAKDAQITERDYGYEFLWISQEDLSEDDAYELAVATNNYLVHLNKVGKLVKGTCYCRSYPEDDYKVKFVTKQDLQYTEIEDATMYEYGIIDDSEYFDEEYTTDWNKALETFNNIARRVQGRLVDMDDEEYDDYYSDGVVVRMIKGKEGTDAFNWDTIREVTVFRDSIENEEELEEQLTTERTAELSGNKELDKVADVKKLVEEANDKLYRVDVFCYTYSRMNPKPHSSKLVPKEFNTFNDALEFFKRVVKPDQTEYTFLDNTADSCIEYVRIVSPNETVEREWYHPLWGSHNKSKTNNTIKRSDVEKYLKSRQEIELSVDEFKYVVNDLWSAIKREMEGGSVYNTIEDVNMIELIDSSDNPTHDLCYKLMGLVGDDD